MTKMRIKIDFVVEVDGEKLLENWISRDVIETLRIGIEEQMEVRGVRGTVAFAPHARVSVTRLEDE